jgi:hypothetical protein
MTDMVNGVPNADIVIIGRRAHAVFRWWHGDNTALSIILRQPIFADASMYARRQLLTLELKLTAHTLVSYL